MGERRYAPEEDVATIARMIAVDELPATGLLDNDRDAVRIVVGELAADAVRHAGTERAAGTAAGPRSSMNARLSRARSSGPSWAR